MSIGVEARVPVKRCEYRATERGPSSCMRAAASSETPSSPRRAELEHGPLRTANTVGRAAAGARAHRQRRAVGRHWRRGRRFRTRGRQRVAATSPTSRCHGDSLDRRRGPAMSAPKYHTSEWLVCLPEWHHLPGQRSLSRRDSTARETGPWSRRSRTRSGPSLAGTRRRAFARTELRRERRVAGRYARCKESARVA